MDRRPRQAGPMILDGGIEWTIPCARMGACPHVYTTFLSGSIQPVLSKKQVYRLLTQCLGRRFRVQGELS